MTSKVIYLGELRAQNIHVRSGSTFMTDAPIDNNGKGEAFSPTDTVATALASCMLTTMGIKARDEGWNIEESFAEITKYMGTKPRRIVKIDVALTVTGGLDHSAQKILEHIAHTCPVFYSLHSEIEKNISFKWI